LVTICNGLDQGLYDGRRMPCSIKKFISLLAVASFSPERRRGLSATGIPFVSI